MSIMSRDVNDIEFSFREEEWLHAQPNIDTAGEMENMPKQISSRRSITAEVIAKIQAIDKEDMLAAGKDGTSVKPRHEFVKELRVDLNGANVSDASNGCGNYDQTGRFAIRNVPIVKSSTSPLGFCIRQGDGKTSKQGIFVSRITKEGLLDTNGSIKVGDEIISVNYVQLEGFSLDDVVRLIQIPRNIILTIKTSALSLKRNVHSEDTCSPLPVTEETTEKMTSKALEFKNHGNRSNDYKEPSNRDKQSQQTEREHFKENNHNANEDQDLSSSKLTQNNSAIEELIRAIREQNKRSRNTQQIAKTLNNFPMKTQVIQAQEARCQTNSAEKTIETGKIGVPKRNNSADSIILSKRTPSSMTRKSSTLTPVTSVNLIFDDSEDLTFDASSHKTTSRKNSTSQDESLKTSTPGTSSRRSLNSPSVSPKMRRRLPRVPSDNSRLIRSISDSSQSAESIATSSKPLLALSSEPRSRRILPTPPASPSSPRKDSNGTSDTSPENQTLEKANRHDGSGLSGNESLDESRSPSRKDSGKSLSHLFSALTSKHNSDNKSDGKEKRKDSQERPEPSRNSLTSQQAPPTQQDILEQQKHSMFLHSISSGSLQPPSFQRRLFSRSSHPNLLMTVSEEPGKEGRKTSVPSQSANGTGDNKDSPKISKRRASLTSIGEHSLANQMSSHDNSDIARLRSDAEPGFMIFPDDYAGQNLLSSHAVSGMVSLHIIKASNFHVTDKKLLEKKKKVHCAVEVDFEQKALTSSKRASKILLWDEMFEVEIQHGRKLSLSCYTSTHEFDKHIAKVSFNLSPFVRFGKKHRVVFRMQPQGVIHIVMGFVEMRTLLQRTPSDRKSGVFGFQLNVTSRNENTDVPLVVRKCVEEIERRGLTSQGLYRISGNARRKKLLHAQFDEDSAAVDLSEDSYPDIHVIAGTLKDYLRELPEPLITESLSKLLIKAAKDQVQDQDLALQKHLLSKLMVQLPQINRETLVYLLNHFMRVISEKESNKMDAHNLSVCFGPVLLCPPANLTESKDLLDLKLHIKVVEFLFYLWKNTTTTSPEV